jgi:hypothetical protein
VVSGVRLSSKFAVVANLREVKWSIIRFSQKFIFEALGGCRDIVVPATLMGFAH